MDNEKRRRKRGIFIRLTKSRAKELIKKREEKKGRKLSREEKNIIIERVAKVARNRTIAVALALGVLGGGVAIGHGLITDGSDTKEPAITTDDNSSSKEESSFIDGIKVDVPEDEKSPIEEEIDRLDTSDEVLKYLKNLYIDEYQEITGIDLMTPGSIKIISNRQNYIYNLDNGKNVTHGDDPALTEQALEQDGQNYVKEPNVDVYRVERKSTGKIIDAMTSDGRAVIPGELYYELKNQESALENMSSIVQTSFDLIGYFDELEHKPGNEYITNLCEEAKQELVKLVTEREEEKQEQSNLKSQEQDEER